MSRAHGPMFSKHLPPSGGPARVLALDASAAAALPEDAAWIGPARVMFSSRALPLAPGQLDAIVGYAVPDHVESWLGLLRPGGRLILAQRAAGQEAAASLLRALEGAGYIHCLVEPAGEFVLYRGERPPHGSPTERTRALSAAAPDAALRPHASRFLFLLIVQTPNKPPWKLAPDEALEWQALTARAPTQEGRALLAFTSLVKAVAFMQAAVLADKIIGVNKVGKFRAERAAAWDLPLVLNPDFDAWRAAAFAPTFAVDPGTAQSGDE